MISVLPFHLAAQQYAVPLEHVLRVVPMLLPTQLPGAPGNIAVVVSIQGYFLSKPLPYDELSPQFEKWHKAV